MKKRTSVLLDADKYRRLEARARRHGRTVSEEIREAVDQVLDEENPNQGWLDLAESTAGIDFGEHPPAGSPEFKPWLRGLAAEGVQEKLDRGAS